MKPKEKFIKWLILLFTVVNFTRSESITYIGHVTYNSSQPDKFDEISTVHSEYVLDDPNFIEVESNKALTRQLLRNEYRDEIFNINKLKVPRKIISRSSRFDRYNVIDTRQNRAIGENRERHREISSLNTDKLLASRTVRLERSLGSINSYPRRFLGQQREIRNRYTSELRVIKSDARLLSRKRSLDRFDSTRQNYIDNSNERTRNNYRATKQSSILTGNWLKIAQREQNNLERNSRYRKFIEAENMKKQNERQQINRNRRDSSRASFVDNLIRFTSEERSLFSNTRKFLNGNFRENAPTIRSNLKEVADKEITLYRQRRNEIKQIDERIHSSREILNNAANRQSTNTNNNYERTGENRHRDTVRRKLISSLINSRRVLNRSTRGGIESNRIEIRQTRLERNRKENRMEMKTETIQNNYPIKTQSFYRNRLGKDERFQRNSGRIKYLTDRKLVSSYLNDPSTERQQNLKERSSLKLNRNSNERERGNIQNRNKHRNFMKEMNVEGSARNIQRNEKQRERISQKGMADKQVSLSETNRITEHIRSIRYLINTRSQNSKIIRKHNNLHTKTRLRRDVISGSITKASLSLENRLKADVRYLAAKSNYRKENLENYNAENVLLPNFNGYRFNRLTRGSRQKLKYRRRNIVSEDRHRKLEADHHDYEMLFLTTLLNTKSYKSHTDNIRARNLATGYNRREEDSNIQRNKAKDKRSHQLNQSVEDNVPSTRSQRQNTLKLYTPIGISRNSRNINRCESHKSRSNLRERNRRTQERKCSEIQFVKDNEISKEIDNFANERKYDRNIRNNRRRIIEIRKRENNLLKDRNVQNKSYRNANKLQLEKVRNDVQRENAYNYRNIRKIVSDAMRLEVNKEHHHKFRTTNNILTEILNNDSCLITNLYNSVRTVRNSKQLSQKTSSKFSGKWIQVETIRNVQIQKPEVTLERRIRNVQRLSLQDTRRRNDRVIGINNDFRLILKIKENTSIQKNIITSERHTKIELRNDNMLKSKAREIRSERFLLKNNLGQRFEKKQLSNRQMRSLGIESYFMQNIPNRNRNIQEKMTVNKIIGRGFRGKIDKLQVKLVRLLPFRRQNIQESKRIIVDLRYADNFQRKSLSTENRNNNLLRERNGRGYRGKLTEQIAERRARKYFASNFKDIHIPLVNMQTFHKMTNNHRFSKSSISAQVHVETRRKLNIKNRVYEKPFIDNILTTMVLPTEANMLVRQAIMLPASKLPEMKSSPRIDTTNSIFMTTGELNFRMYTSEKYLRLDRRLNMQSFSRSFNRNSPKKLNYRARESEYFDNKFRNAQSYNVLNARQKSTNFYEFIRKNSFPLNHHNQRQISRNSPRYLDTREESGKIRIRSDYRDENRRVLNRENHSSMTRDSISEKNKILMPSALEVFLLPKSSITQKRQSSRIQHTHKGHSSIQSAGLCDYWKKSGSSILYFTVNIILGLLIIMATSETNGIKSKSFKERLDDIMFLRFSIF